MKSWKNVEIDVSMSNDSFDQSGEQLM